MPPRTWDPQREAHERALDMATRRELNQRARATMGQNEAAGFGDGYTHFQSPDSRAESDERAMALMHNNEAEDFMKLRGQLPPAPAQRPKPRVEPVDEDALRRQQLREKYMGTNVIYSAKGLGENFYTPEQLRELGVVVPPSPGQFPVGVRKKGMDPALQAWTEKQLGAQQSPGASAPQEGSPMQETVDLWSQVPQKRRAVLRPQR